MADDRPITLSVLAKFHREVILPDIERVVSGVEFGLRDDTQTLFHALTARLDRLETEYQMLVAGLKRVEERLDRVEWRLDRVEGRLDNVDGRLDKIETRLERLETGLDRVEKRLD